MQQLITACSSGRDLDDDLQEAELWKAGDNSVQLGHRRSFTTHTSVAHEKELKSVAL